MREVSTAPESDEGLATPDGAAGSESLAHAPPIRSGFRLQTFSSLRHRNFRYLWLGTMCMGIGQWIQQVTLGWLMYDLTGSAVLLGVLNGLRSIPFLVVAPLGGVVADRMDRRKLVMGAQVVLLVSALGMGVLVVSGWLQVWHLFAFTLLTALAWSFNQTVRHTLVPNVVPRAELSNAIALNSVGFNFNKILAPAVGGLLIAWFGAGGNFFVQGGAYVGVLAMIFLMQVPPTPPEARKVSVLSNLREGLAYVRSTPLVLGMVLAALVPNLLAMPVYQSLMPVFQKDVFNAGPEALGLLLAAPGAGAVAATLFLASFGNSIRRKGRLMLGGLVLLGVSILAFAHAPTLPLAMLALVGVGGFQLLFGATTQMVIHMTVPDALRGRVMSIYLLDHGIAPLGALLGGIGTHYMGAPTTVAIAGGLIVLAAGLLAWRIPSVRRQGMEED